MPVFAWRRRSGRAPVGVGEEYPKRSGIWRLRIRQQRRAASHRSLPRTHCKHPTLYTRQSPSRRGLHLHACNASVFRWRGPCFFGECPCLIGKCPCLIGECAAVGLGRWAMCFRHYAFRRGRVYQVVEHTSPTPTPTPPLYWGGVRFDESLIVQHEPDVPEQFLRVV